MKPTTVSSSNISIYVNFESASTKSFSVSIAMELMISSRCLPHRSRVLRQAPIGVLVNSMDCDDYQVRNV